MPQLFDIVREPRDRKKDARFAALSSFGSALGSSIGRAGRDKQKKTDAIEVNQAAQADLLEAQLIQGEINQANSARDARRVEATKNLEAAKKLLNQRSLMSIKHPKSAANPELRGQAKALAVEEFNLSMADPDIAEFFPDMVMNERQADEQWLQQTTKKRVGTGGVGKVSQGNFKDDEKRKTLRSILDPQLTLGEQKNSGSFDESAISKFSRLTHQRSDLDISPNTTGVPEIPTGLASGADRFLRSAEIGAELTNTLDPFNPLGRPTADPAIAANALKVRETRGDNMEMAEFLQSSIKDILTVNKGVSMSPEDTQRLKDLRGSLDKFGAKLAPSLNTPDPTATKSWNFNTKALANVAPASPLKPVGEFDNVARPSNGFKTASQSPTDKTPANKAEFTQNIQDLESLMGAEAAQAYFEKFGSRFK